HLTRWCGATRSITRLALDRFLRRRSLGGRLRRRRWPGGGRLRGFLRRLLAGRSPRFGLLALALRLLSRAKFHDARDQLLRHRFRKRESDRSLVVDLVVGCVEAEFFQHPVGDWIQREVLL